MSTNPDTPRPPRHGPLIMSSRGGAYAHCSCGWKGGADRGWQASVLWAEHVADATRRASGDTPETTQ